jgi:uncharacterized repeat protein (TIGR01451 family)
MFFIIPVQEAQVSWSGCRMHHRAIMLVWLAAVPGIGSAAGTVAGTDIVTRVEVAYEIGAETFSGVSNVVTITVVELIDLNLFVQTPERLVSPGVSDQPLYFTVTNTGNGTETLELTPVMTITGDQFDPLPAATAVVLDVDGDGVLSSADSNYLPGTNDPVLDPDQSLGAFLVADIPPGLGDGLFGFAQLRVSSATATGSPGDVFIGLGDTGVDVVLGPSGGFASGQGEYLVGEVGLSLTKVASIDSPQGDGRPMPGARLTYAIQVVAVGTGTAGAALFRDPIPAHTVFVPGSLRLNGTPLSDATDADSGEYVAAAPEVVVRLGDLQPSDPAQLIEFTVSIE